MFSPKTSKYSETISVERKTHNGEKPYECDDCNQRFEKRKRIP